MLYEAVKVNVSSIGSVTGNLGRAVYQAFSPEHSIDGVQAQYHVSWNARKAPHGHLLERGWVQRYAVTIAKGGKWVTRVRPEAQGKPRPRRRATQAEKDAYYEPRPGVPSTGLDISLSLALKTPCPKPLRLRIWSCKAL